MAVKKTANIEPTWGTCKGRPFLRAAASRAVCTSRPSAVEARVRIRFLQQFQGGDAGGHRQRVAAERSGLVHRAERGQKVHDLRPAAESADRQAAADDLAQGGQVRRDLLQLLHSAAGQPETGHHLVEDQQRAVGGAERRADRRG